MRAASVKALVLALLAVVAAAAPVPAAAAAVLAVVPRVFRAAFAGSVPAAVTAAAPAAAAGDGDAGGGEVQDSFTVVLTSFGDKKINVIKEIRVITGLGLKEAKDFVEGAPNNVKEGITKEEAEELKKKLDETGATVEIK